MTTKQHKINSTTVVFLDLWFSIKFVANKEPIKVKVLCVNTMLAPEEHFHVPLLALLSGIKCAHFKHRKKNIYLALGILFKYNAVWSLSMCRKEDRAYLVHCTLYIWKSLVVIHLYCLNPYFDCLIVPKN